MKNVYIEMYNSPIIEKDKFESLQNIVAKLENPIKYLDMWLEIHLILKSIQNTTEEMGKTKLITKENV